MDWDLIKIALRIAFVAVGIIEWIKAGIDLAKTPKEARKISGIVAWAALPVASFGAAALYDGGLWTVLSHGGEAWATAQIAYPLIVKLPAELIGLLKAKASA